MNLMKWLLALVCLTNLSLPLFANDDTGEEEDENKSTIVYPDDEDSGDNGDAEIEYHR